jgi:hypothetical protein
MNEHVLQALLVLEDAYPNGKKFTETSTAVWVAALKDLPERSLRLAVQQLVSKQTFMPSIAEIRHAAMAATSDLGERNAEEAWGAVLGAISRYGWSRQPQFEDPLVERALQCTIGWYDLCTSNLEDGPSHRARFIAAYEGLHRKTVEGRLLPDALRRQIADCRKDFVAGTLGGNGPQDYISDQRREALKALSGFGAGGEAP